MNHFPLLNGIPLFGLSRRTLETDLLERPLVCVDEAIRLLAELQSIRLLLAGMSCSTCCERKWSYTFDAQCIFTEDTVASSAPLIKLLAVLEAVANVKIQIILSGCASK